MLNKRFLAAFLLSTGLSLLPVAYGTAQEERDPPPPGERPGANRREEGPPRQPRPRPEGERPDVRGEGPRGGGSGDPGRGPDGSDGPRGPGAPGGPRRPGGPGIGPGPGGPRFGGPGGGGPMGPQHDWEQLKKYDPEMYKLELADHDLQRQTADLSEQYRRLPKDQRTDLRKELEETVSKHFEIRQQKRQLQLTRFEKELQRMREEIERRGEKRAEIVGKRMAELVGEQSDIDF